MGSGKGHSYHVTVWGMDQCVDTKLAKTIDRGHDRDLTSNGCFGHCPGTVVLRETMVDLNQHGVT